MNPSRGGRNSLGAICHVERENEQNCQERSPVKGVWEIEGFWNIPWPLACILVPFKVGFPH